MWFVFIPLGTLVSSFCCILEVSVMNIWNWLFFRFLLWQCQNSRMIRQDMLISQTSRSGDIQGLGRLYFHMESLNFIACLQVSWKPLRSLLKCTVLKCTQVQNQTLQGFMTILSLIDENTLMDTSSKHFLTFVVINLPSITMKQNTTPCCVLEAVELVLD